MMERPTTRVWEAAGFIMFTMVISRILGYVRDVFIYASFGQNRLTDAYNAAFSIPDFLYMLLVGGALSSAFIPVFSSYIANKNEEEGWTVANIIYSCILALLVIGVAIGLIFTPQLVRLLVPGFDSESMRLTIRLTRIMFAQVFFMSLAGISMGILNSYKQFSAPAIGSMIYNLGIILGGLLLMKPIEAIWPGNGIAGFSIGVVLGAAMNFFVQVPALRKVGMKFRFNFDFRHPGVITILKLMLPVFIGLAVSQINLFVSQNIASMFPAGIVAALRTAQRLMQLPISIFAIAIAVAFFPTMTAYASRGEMNEFKHSTMMGMRSVLFVCIPSTIALAVLGTPLIRFMFEFGSSKFTPEATLITSRALLFYCVGIFAYGCIHILSRSFYALKDTKTPVTAGVISIVVNILLSILLSRIANYIGLALAYSLAGIFNMGFLLYLLRRKIGIMGGRILALSAVKTGLAALVMGALLLVIRLLCGHYLPMDHKMIQLFELLLCFVLGVATFIGTAFLLKMEEAKMVLDILLRRRHKNRLGSRGSA